MQEERRIDEGSTGNLAFRFSLSGKECKEFRLNFNLNSLSKLNIFVGMHAEWQRRRSEKFQITLEEDEGKKFTLHPFSIIFINLFV